MKQTHDELLRRNADTPSENRAVAVIVQLVYYQREHNSGEEGNRPAFRFNCLEILGNGAGGVILQNR